MVSTTHHHRSRWLALVLAIAFLGVIAPEAQASSPGWVLACTYDHSAMDDPIVFPGLPGASHMHDFIGAKDANAFSTDASMKLAGTSCTLPGDTAGYWFPAFMRDGVHILPATLVGGPTVKERIYYRDSNLTAGTVLQPFPSGLRMIAGNGKALTVAENPKLGKELYYGCSDNSTPKMATPPASCATGVISVHLGFPNCWDGIHLDSIDHKSHVTYPSSGKCPLTHPVPMPRLIVRLEIPVGTTTGNLTLASGPTYTLHADFWNTWDQAKLSELVSTCLNADKDCGIL